MSVHEEELDVQAAELLAMKERLNKSEAERIVLAERLATTEHQLAHVTRIMGAQHGPIGVPPSLVPDTPLAASVGQQVLQHSRHDRSKGLVSSSHQQHVHHKQPNRLQLVIERPNIDNIDDRWQPRSNSRDLEDNGHYSDHADTLRGDHLSLDRHRQRNMHFNIATIPKRKR
eukprot:XP_015575336.1 uncharacterized protein LOC107261335 [Ricinus communis]